MTDCLGGEDEILCSGESRVVRRVVPSIVISQPRGTAGDGHITGNLRYTAQSM